MYSRDKGLFKGVAKGVKKPKSLLGGRMELFVANKLLINKGKNLDTINQAEAINTFFDTRKDMDKLFYSMYVSEVVNNFGIEDDPNCTEVFDVLYKTLELISKSRNKTAVIFNVLKFQLKIMDITGYGISLENCVKCNQSIEENAFFSIVSGGIICENCAKYQSNLTKINKKIINFLNDIFNSKLDEETQYDDVLTEKFVCVCFDLLKNYINYYSPKKFKTDNILELVK